MGEGAGFNHSGPILVKSPGVFEVRVQKTPILGFFGLDLPGVFFVAACLPLRQGLIVVGNPGEALSFYGT